MQKRVNSIYYGKMANFTAKKKKNVLQPGAKVDLVYIAHFALS